MDELRGRQVVLRAMQPEDAAALRMILAAPEVASWWGPAPPEFPQGDDPQAQRLTIHWNGAVAGLIQFTEETEPEYRHASLDIFLDPRFHGRGLGTDAIEVLLRHLVDDRGHHRITIDPAIDNGAAIRCYEKAGFNPVGVMRAAWRDGSGKWRDLLLMEIVSLPA